jgi:hypothetical protein
LAKEGNLQFIETSAKEGKNVDEVFALITDVVLNKIELN